MSKMWEGVTNAETDKAADDFNSSIATDCRMYRQDITGSIAHVKMLSKCGIITSSESDTIREALSGILNDIESGALKIDFSCEDIHMFVERELTLRIGDTGKKLHTARSRNDQVALDLRMYLRDETAAITENLKKLVSVLSDRAETDGDVVMAGYTHLQRAQPVLLGHYLLAYAFMFLRDCDRLSDTLSRINISPIGACALAGTTYPTDREYEAQLLNFSGVCQNSLDAVSDRDFCVELAADISLIMVHLSRLAEETILWSSKEFSYMTLSDALTTGSSIMPQKKNPDMAELVRGKSGRVFGDLFALLTLLKGLPLAYNKDMQEDKTAIFDACDTVKLCIDIFTRMISTAVFNKDKMSAAAKEGFINATDLADYLVSKGLPFRDAYKISGRIVARCTADGYVLETLPFNIYKEYCPLVEQDVYAAVDLTACATRRTSLGGTSPKSVMAQLEIIRKSLT